MHTLGSNFETGGIVLVAITDRAFIFNQVVPATVQTGSEEE